MKGRKHLLRLLSVGLAALLFATWSLAASGQSPPPASEERWQVYKRTADGFAIALPPNWKEVGSLPGASDPSRRAFSERNPEIARMLEWQRNNIQGAAGVFSAVEWPPPGPEGFVSVAIVKRDLPVELRLEDWIQVTLTAYERMSFIEKPVSNQRVTLKVGEAERLQYRMNMNLPTGKTLSLSVDHYMIVKGASLYQLVLNASSGQAEKYSSLFDKIAQSLEWLE